MNILDWGEMLTIGFAISISMYVFLLYKPRSKGGNGFRWSIAPVGFIFAKQISDHGLTETALVTALLVIIVMCPVLWLFGYFIYGKEDAS